MKICSLCNKEKQLSEYYFRNKNNNIYRKECKSCCINRIKKNSSLNVNSIKSYKKVWYNKNKEEILKKKMSKYVYSNRIKNSKIINKLSERMRIRIWNFLNIKNMQKNNSTFEIIGCTPINLKIYLESKFENNMSWDNYGKFGWHIDHIIPLASAKIENDILKLCHYTNLQPLWWDENLSKGSKIL